MKKKKVKLTPGFRLFLKIVGIFSCICLGLFLFYLKEINDLKRIGYSSLASKKILFSFHKDYVMNIGENKTLNKAFESPDFMEENMDNYSKINYVNHKHFISNINRLIKVGYNNNDINIILSHGTDSSVLEFSKREKIKYLEEFFSIDYAKLENYDRYVKYSDESGEDCEDVVLYVNLDMDREDYTNSTLVSDFSFSMLVNKHHHLKEDFVPSNLITIPSKYASSDDIKCNGVAFNAFRKMQDAASLEGLNLVVNSCYRSYQDQIDIQELYRKTYGDNYVEKYVAKPGFSEHQTGLGLDIGSRSSNVFANSKEYLWIQENAHKYGFIYRFQKKHESITGFRNEAWHYRYVGEEISNYIYEHHNMAFEEYWALFLDK